MSTELMNIVQLTPTPEEIYRSFLHLPNASLVLLEFTRAHSCFLLLS